MSVDRAQLVRDAHAMLDVLDSGTVPGSAPSLAPALARMAAGTQLYSPEALGALGGARPRGPHATRVTVTPETTLEAALRLLGEAGDPVAALNFASATTPGGGFLSGSAAQEESLCRATALYGALRGEHAYYAAHRGQDVLYTHRAVYSQDVPILRDATGRWLDGSAVMDVLTAAAPNLRGLDDDALGTVRPRAEAALAERAALVLGLFQHRRCERLILGAWGAGAFRNDPRFVARTFRTLLDGPYRGVFREVVFAVFAMPWEQRNLGAFRETWPGASAGSG